jgi:hypothetical protein
MKRIELLAFLLLLVFGAANVFSYGLGFGFVGQKNFEMALERWRANEASGQEEAP